VSDAEHRTHDALIELLPDDEVPDWDGVVARAESRGGARHHTRTAGGVAGAIAAVAAAAVGLVVLLPGGGSDSSQSGTITDATTLITTPFRVLRPGGEVTSPTFRIADHRGAPVVMVVITTDCPACVRIGQSPTVKRVQSRPGVVSVYAVLARDRGSSATVGSDRGHLGGDWVLRAPMVEIDTATLRSFGVEESAPAIVVFDGQGKVADVLNGGVSEDTLRTRLQLPSPTLVSSYPDTAKGRGRALGYLRSLSSAPGQGGADYQPVPASLRPVYWQNTALGEYTVWHARNRGRGETTLFSSPRAGVSSRSGPATPLPSGSYVRVEEAGGWPPPFAVRELWGRSSPDVRRLSIQLGDDRRVEVIPQGGWWSFTQSFQDPAPQSVVGYDAQGRVVARTTGRIF